MKYKSPKDAEKYLKDASESFSKDFTDIVNRLAESGAKAHKEYRRLEKLKEATVEAKESLDSLLDYIDKEMKKIKGSMQVK